ncbi:Hypothetical protein Cul131001_0554 [Corynebacterium ulcerans]|uniref:Transposase n=1 Tax=Corynebacterium ulcerans FRC58 TaxID=1408268 RepID=A0ABN4GRY2_CORUL|nr:Hypothetical protein Cul05146_0562 [Corynebacterium ulcerans]AKN76443.1 Hypothetical protein CulFRC58_0589 [Corynebacterium ulcerans FRC58]ALD94279.1 Hypothetical protein Cul131001_0554 [Corynebacterium ulcerans]
MKYAANRKPMLILLLRVGRLNNRRCNSAHKLGFLLEGTPFWGCS